MGKRIFSKILWVFFLFAIMGNAHAAEVQPADLTLDASIMRPDIETLQRWVRDYERAPRALINPEITNRLSSLEVLNVGSSLDLLGYLQYTPNERNQGNCGNCWVWAGTGVMEMALSAQNGIKDRLSTQFLNSCDGTGSSYACCGGNLSDFVNWYNARGFTIPWANTNASYHDGNSGCGGASTVTCGSISTMPNYSITSAQEQVIQTTGVSQATAISNIKNILNQNKAVWFAFYLANQTDWNQFYNFWSNQPETTLWTPDAFCGHVWDNNTGGGHAIVIVGYNDDDPNAANHYWTVLNSWGTAGGMRPNGLLRMPMQMNYGCTLSSSQGSFYSREFETIGINFGSGSTSSIMVTSPNGGETWNAGTTHAINWTYTGNPGSSLKIELYKGGVLNSTLSSSAPIGTNGSGSSSWTIPSSQASGSDYTIKVTSTTSSAYSDTSNSSFTITGATPAGIAVVSPNGGETWNAGTTHAINWTYTSNPGTYVKIELYKGGVLNRTISSMTSRGSNGAGSFNWVVPSTQTSGSAYSVKVTSTTSSAYSDTSNSTFTIVGPLPPSVTVVSANGGETWQPGTVHTIRWTYTGNPGSYVKIDLYKGGVYSRSITYSSIGSGGSGSYNWLVPSSQAHGSNYRIRITSMSNSAITDMSDADFSM